MRPNRVSTKTIANRVAMFKCYLIPKKIQLAVVVIISVVVATPLLAQEKKLRIGVAGSPPFVIKHENKPPEGISVEIWEALAKENKLTYELIPQNSVKTGIEGVEQGKIDILIGPVSITADRLKKVAFTQPYFQADIGLMLPLQQPTVWEAVKPFFRSAVIYSVGLLILAFFLVGNLIWLAEKRRNTQQFPAKYLPGVTNAVWFAIVTFTTVGYGDKAPITKTGRFVTAVWMLITVVAASTVTAGLTTALTLAVSGQATEKFQDVRGLKNARVSVVSGTTSASWAAYHQAREVESKNLQEAIERLMSSQADALIFDKPALQYYLREHPEVSLRVSDLAITSENYGFVISWKNPLLPSLNVSLVHLKEKGDLQNIIDKWLN